MNRAALGLAIALTLGVASCHQAPPIQLSVAEVPAIQGRILDDAYHTSATITNDIAKGATVSLIDTVTGQTKGTTVTRNDGSFTLSFGTGFQVDPNRAYYMEAVKGLPVGLSPNRAGAPIARVRTLLFYRSGWVSLSSSAISGMVTLNTATTAVSAIVGLKSLSIANQNTLIGMVTGGTLDPSVTAISQTDFSQVYGLVAEAIANDQDPLEAISYDASLSQFARRAGTLVLNDTLLAKVNPSGTFTVTGQNLPLTSAEATVTVGMLPVATWSVTPSRTSMAVTLTAKNYTGHLQISEDKGTWTGPFVPIQGTVGTIAGKGLAGFQDGRGRSAMFNSPLDLVVDGQDNLYVTDMNNLRVRKITPNGEVTTFAGSGVGGYTDGTGTAASFQSLQGLGIDASGNLLVTSVGRVRRVSPAGVVTTMDTTGTFSANPASPYGFATTAYDAAAYGGSVYVVTAVENKIWKATPGSGVTVFAGSGTSGTLDGNIAGNPGGMQLSSPIRLVIDTDGTFYVTQNSSDNIRRILPNGDTQALTTGYTWQANPGSWLAAAGGVAVSGTQLYFGTFANVCKVTSATGAGFTKLTGSPTNGSGYVDGPASLSLSANYPKGVAVDSRGFVYFVDTSNHVVRVLVP